MANFLSKTNAVSYEVDPLKLRWQNKRKDKLNAQMMGCLLNHGEPWTKELAVAKQAHRCTYHNANTELLYSSFREREVMIFITFLETDFLVC